MILRENLARAFALTRLARFLNVTRDRAVTATAAVRVKIAATFRLLTNHHAAALAFFACDEFWLVHIALLRC
jgi:hypothetical protein